MGLLDDAIREHLELKRRHGADPDEVARQEDEALGPTAAEPEPARGRERRAEAGADRRPTSREPERRADEAPAAPSPSRSREPEPGRRRASPGGEPAFDVQQPTVEFSVEDEPPRPPPERGRAAPTSRRGAGRRCSRRRRSSSRRRPSTTGSGSSRSRRATSTSEHRAPAHLAGRLHATPLAGNGLAVVHDADEPRRRDDARLRARDAPQRDDLRAVADATPAPTTATGSGRSAGELPFAGHPSLGTAVAVAHRARRDAGALRPADAAPACSRSRSSCDGRPRARAVDAPGARPSSGADADPARAAAQAGLAERDLHPELPPQFVATGVPQLIVPLAGRVALDARAPGRGRSAERAAGRGRRGHALHGRGRRGRRGLGAIFFAEGRSVMEDPATGQRGRSAVRLPGSPTPGIASIPCARAPR